MRRPCGDPIIGTESVAVRETDARCNVGLPPIPPVVARPVVGLPTVEMNDDDDELDPVDMTESVRARPSRRAGLSGDGPGRTSGVGGSAAGESRPAAGLGLHGVSGISSVGWGGGAATKDKVGAGTGLNELKDEVATLPKGEARAAVGIGPPSSDARARLVIRPVDMNAACNGLTFLMFGVA